MPTTAYYTLGCKVNQYETEKIREEMEKRGFQTVSFDRLADIYIINSCTVTATADSKSRKAIRAAVHKNPKSLVVATGCYAHLRPEEIQAIPGVDLVVSNLEKDQIPDRIIRHLPESAMPDPSFNSQLSTFNLRQRTRAILKVQDGCDNFCAYCAVPLARSVIYSRPLDDVLAEAKALSEQGFKEIVLTGIRLGKYYSKRVRLPQLIERICDVQGIERVRLSSIEPMEVTEELLETVARPPKVCRHLHIPLQSGDDEILRRMNRPYTREEFVALAGQAKTLIPRLGLTTDVMVGFPGETDEQFKNTIELIEEIRFSRLHVFRFSARPGTAAETMSDRVSPTEMERRSKALISLGRCLMQEFAERLVGQIVKVLVEGRRTKGGVLSGLTDNYVETVFEGPRNLKGRIVEVMAMRAENGRLVGELASS